MAITTVKTIIAPTVVARRPTELTTVLAHVAVTTTFVLT
jgi:hypothetical protein